MTLIKMVGLDIPDEIGTPRVRSKLKPVKTTIRRRRVEHVKATNKVNNIIVIQQTREFITLKMDCYYKNVEKPTSYTVTFPLPDPKKIFQRVKKKHPAWTNQQVKQRVRILLKKFIEDQIKDHWKKNKPTEESIHLENEISMT